MSKKLQYREICRQFGTDFLKQNLVEPSSYMRPIHLAIIKCVIRERSARV